jgi:hypothetical protein
LFTIQYPSDWKPIGDKNGSVIFTSPLDFSSGRHISTVTVGVRDVNATSLNQLISQFKSSNATKPFFDSKIIDESSTTLSGVPARKIIEESNVLTTTIKNSLVEILALKDGKQYFIGYQVGEPDDLSIIQQMIDSFQITG